MLLALAAVHPCRPVCNVPLPLLFLSLYGRYARENTGKQSFPHSTGSCRPSISGMRTLGLWLAFKGEPQPLPGHSFSSVSASPSSFLLFFLLITPVTRSDAHIQYILHLDSYSICNRLHLIGYGSLVLYQTPSRRVSPFFSDRRINCNRYTYISS